MSTRKKTQLADADGGLSAKPSDARADQFRGLTALEFDEAFYLTKNPDVAEAVRRGDWPSGLTHYCVIGKSKGRPAAKPMDSEWYLRAYPQASMDIASGRATSAEDHYYRIGRYRGYLPSRTDTRPNNPAEYRSRFGGLWTDVGNAADIIAGRLDLGYITQDQAKLLTKWITDGYVILPGAIPEATLEKAEADLDRAYKGEMPGLRFAIHGLSQNCDWTPEALTKPAKALDLHWFSSAARELIFSAKLLEFMHLIFERRVLATQTLGFWRGSAQDAHQDSAYVNYSLPMQFAASWIALEDVNPGAGELFYYVGSHRLPEFFYGGKFKGAEEAKRVVPDIDLTHDYPRHIELIRMEAAGAGLGTDRFLAKRGDVLIWSGDLAHGGGAISATMSRKSVVTHYCPAEVVPQYFESKASTRIKQFGSTALYTTAQY
jgi:phytanoyl-CoA hydroxylase